jgi:hypothetical protein
VGERDRHPTPVVQRVSGDEVPRHQTLHSHTSCTLHCIIAHLHPPSTHLLYSEYRATKCRATSASCLSMGCIKGRPWPTRVVSGVVRKREVRAWRRKRERRDLQSLCNHSAIARERSAIDTQSMCNRRANTAQTLYNNFAIAYGMHIHLTAQNANNSTEYTCICLTVVVGERPVEAAPALAQCGQVRHRTTVLNTQHMHRRVRHAHYSTEYTCTSISQ